jgi:TetR/AcrR family transcriptional regulator, cholesterol catabolism regulator
MARPLKTDRSNATRERILAAAANVLSAKGYAATRLCDIAEVAEIRAPAVYYYFSSREELVAEVMVVGQEWVRKHVAAALDLLPPETSALDRICVAVEAHLRVELELSDFATAVTRNAGQLPPDIRERLAAESAEYHNIWRGLLDDGLMDGSIRPELDLRTARMLTIGALNWAPEWWHTDRGSIDAVIATAQSFVRGSLAYRR